MNYKTDLSKDFPAALKRFIALKTGVIGGVTIEAAPVDDIQYYRSCDVPVSNLWKVILSQNLIERPEFEGLRGFAETFNVSLDRFDRPDHWNARNGGSFCLYAFSDEDGYNVTFVCRTEVSMDFPSDAAAADYGDDDDDDDDDNTPVADSFNLFYGDVNNRECRGTHKPLPVDDWTDALIGGDDDPDHDAIAMLVDRQIEAMWPEHISNIAEAFWVFLRSPFDCLSSIAPQEMLAWETPEGRRDREMKEVAAETLFYRLKESARQALSNARPQVR